MNYYRFHTENVYLHNLSDTTLFMVKSSMDRNDVLTKLKSMSSKKAVAGMARFGINTENACGVPVPSLRKLAAQIGIDHSLAQKLWKSKIHEARILACFIDDPEKVSEEQMEKWVYDLDSWDICDLCCGNLFDSTEFAYAKAVEWSARKEEFMKRAGFVIMAALAVHDKNRSDSTFLRFLPMIRRECIDERNFVKRSVNWALRQIGKRSMILNRAALRTAGEIQKLDSASARWIASDAIRELTSQSVQGRLRRH
jgi:3-methyladenine DNA glycosylase AlkD